MLRICPERLYILVFATRVERWSASGPASRPYRMLSLLGGINSFVFKLPTPDLDIRIASAGPVVSGVAHTRAPPPANLTQTVRSHNSDSAVCTRSRARIWLRHLLIRQKHPSSSRCVKWRKYAKDAPVSAFLHIRSGLSTIAACIFL